MSKKEKLSEYMSVNAAGELVLSVFGEKFKINGLLKKDREVTFVQINQRKIKRS